jgi:hypothetical protein
MPVSASLMPDWLVKGQEPELKLSSEHEPRHQCPDKQTNRSVGESKVYR